MIDISYGKPLQRAWSRMQLILFSPFDLGKWFVMGFTAWLASLAEGGTSSSNLGWEYGPDLRDGDWSDLATSTADRWRDLIESGVEFFIVSVLFVVGIIIALVLIWLSARGSFLFLDNVVHNRALVSDPWRRFSRQGDSLFLWRILFALVTVVVIGSLVLASVLMVVPLLDEGVGRGIGIVGLVVLFSLMFLLALVVAFVSLLVDHFVVPLMYKHDLTVTAAWRMFLPLLQEHSLSFVLYGLFYLVLSIAVAIVVGLLAVMTCCVGLLIIAIPYLGTVLLLPLYVTSRGLGLEFLAQFGPEFTLLVNEESNGSATT